MAQKMATGVFKQLRIAKETEWGVASTAAGRLLRRTQSTLDPNKDSYQSQEINPSMQTRDMRHGMLRIGGGISGELSPGTYFDLQAAMLRRNFTAGATSGALTTVSATSGTPAKFSRTAGSWVVDGFRVGDVVRGIGFTGPAAANNNRNYRILALTALDMTVAGIGKETVVTVAAGDSVTFSAVGKKTFVPASAHTSDSFTIEHWFSDIGESELFLGCVPASMDFGLPPTGMVSFGSSFLGRDIRTGKVAHFASPAPASTSTILAAVNGTLRLNGEDVATVTGASFSINGGHSVDPSIGTNLAQYVFPGNVVVQGQLTAFFPNGVFRDLFLNENEVSLQTMLTTSNDLNADFMAFTMPRIKLGGAGKNDGTKAIVQTLPFIALEGFGTGNAEATTIAIQDSLAA